MGKIKKWLVISAAILAGVVAVPSPSSAYVYIAVSASGLLSPIVILALRAILGINGITFLSTWFAREPLTTVFMFISTVLVLDEKQVVPALRYQPMNQMEANATGLTSLEMASYNRDLPLVNLAFDEFLFALSRNPTVKSLHTSDDKKMEVAKNLLHQIYAEAKLPELTISAVEKITQHSLIPTD